jgi:hypothetical protein
MFQSLLPHHEVCRFNGHCPWISNRLFSLERFPGRRKKTDGDIRKHSLTPHLAVGATGIWDVVFSFLYNHSNPGQLLAGV